MSTYHRIMVYDDQNEEYRISKGKVLMPQCAEPFSHNYFYREDLDNHNAVNHLGRTKQHVGLENVCINYRWNIGVFEFYSMNIGTFICMSQVFSK